ncbi:hypothetical protein Tco_0456754 [Tanacetum coccineum]
MEALIAGMKTPWIRIVAEMKDHKSKHDSDDDRLRPMMMMKALQLDQTGQTGKKKLCKADLEGPAFNLVKAFYKNSVFLQYQMDECHKLLTNSCLDVTPEGDKERKIALSISKLKALRYLDFGLKELVHRLWVESERDMTSVRISKNPAPNDFEDLFLLNIQESSKPFCPWKDKISLHADYQPWNVQIAMQQTIIQRRLYDSPKPRAVSTETKNYNKGMEIGKWTEDDKCRVRPKTYPQQSEKRIQIRGSIDKV